MFFIFVNILIYWMLSVDSSGFLDQILQNPQTPDPTTLNNVTCFDNLGCVEITEQWFHPTFRPINLPPLDRHTIKTEIHIITKLNKSDNVKLDFNLIAKGSDLILSPNDSKVVVLIHDFTSNGYTGWIKHIAASYVKRKKATVLSIDWQAGAEPPFEQAIANARVVALEIVGFFKYVKNIQCDSITIIGHGVGAHIAGYVGKAYRLYKIIGLDPTGPFFEDMPPIVRLDHTDASTVEVIHTDAYSDKSQGTMMTLGDYDFFVNGAHKQPDCEDPTNAPIFTELDRNSLKEGAILPACSHKRAFKYYIESLQSHDCEFIGFQCKDYKDFQEGKCTECFVGGKVTCMRMGDTQKTNKATSASYFLNVAETAPFCMNPYKVKIHFDNELHGKAERNGRFELILISGKGVAASARPSSDGPVPFTTTEPHTMVYYAKPPLVVGIVEVRLKWINNPSALCMFCNSAVYVKEVHVQVISLLKNKQSVVDKLCPNHEMIEIKSGVYLTFTKCNQTTITNIR